MIENRFVRTSVMVMIIFTGIMIITATLIEMIGVTDVWIAFIISSILVSATALIAFIIPKEEIKKEV